MAVSSTILAINTGLQYEIDKIFRRAQIQIAFLSQKLLFLQKKGIPSPRSTPQISIFYALVV